MTPRDRLVVMVLAVVALMGAGWFLVVGPHRAEAGQMHAQLTAATQQRDQVLQQVAAGRAAQQTVAEDRAAFVALGKAVPPDAQTASLLYDLQALAGRSHVDMSAIAPSTTAPAAAPTPNAANTSGTSTTTPNTASTASTAAAPAGPAPAGMTPSTVDLTFTGSYRNLQRFLHRVDDLIALHGTAVSVRGRLVSIQSLALATAPQGASGLTATITADVYTAPTPVPATPALGTEPGAPAATSANTTVPAAIPASTP